MVHSVALRIVAVVALIITAFESAEAQVSRGPYLQTGTSTSVTVRWKTTAESNSRVKYGTSPSQLNLTADDAASVLDHTVVINNLLPRTKYYYSIGTSTNTSSTTTPEQYFITSPPIGTRTPTRIWIIGDSGTGNTNAAAVRDAYLKVAQQKPADLWLMLGDNAYTDGTQDQYTKAVFNMYPTILKNTVLWSTFGNHDGHA